MENLKIARENSGKKQSEIALFLKIPRTTYANYEQGKSEPNITMLISLADLYGVSLDYLCGHQSKNIIQIDSLTDIQKQVVLATRGLTDEQSLMLLGYIGRLKEQPIENLISAIKNKKE